MSIDRIIPWITAIVVAFAAAGRLDILQMWIWRAQARAVQASRTSTWGSPDFWRTPGSTPKGMKFEIQPKRPNANSGEGHSHQ